MKYAMNTRPTLSAGDLSAHDVLSWPPTVDLPTGGKALGISRDKAYRLARAGEFPVKLIPVGPSYRVVTADLIRILELDSLTGTGGR